MGSSFRDNGNSFNSCFQFEGWSPQGELFINVKIYNKTLAFLQSETTAKSIGMNMKALFYPSMRMGKALKESSGESLTRIEISYKASTIAAQTELFDDEFSMRTTIDLYNAQEALNEVHGIGWHVPVKELFEGLQQGARCQQLLIVEHSIAVMLYAENAKTSCYTG